MYTHLAVFSLNLITCTCYVNYDQFRGFGSSTRNHHTFLPGIESEQLTDNTENTEAPSLMSSTQHQLNFTSANDDFLNTPVTRRRKPRIKVREFQLMCPENERPLAVGTYEIPTQRDLVLFTKRTLVKMFNSYHKKTLFLLKDIKEATRATAELEKKCHHGRGKRMYRKCVKQISKQCVSITKDLVKTLEQQEAEVAALTEDRICTMTSMRTDPIQLIKLLAMEEATLDFALPAFLRLLGECTTYCSQSLPPDNRPRLRQLSDQELVVRHFLTRKNYVQLIKDTNKYV